MCSGILVFEAIVMLLGMFVVGGIAGWLAAACIVAVGTLGRPWGYTLGHLAQVAIVGLGYLSLPMLFLGLVFAGLWIASYVVGMKVDRDRAIR